MCVGGDMYMCVGGDMYICVLGVTCICVLEALNLPLFLQFFELFRVWQFFFHFIISIVKMMYVLIYKNFFFYSQETVC